MSPGSVYQYFPNKDVIIHEAVERMIRQIGESLGNRVWALYTTAPDDGIRNIIVATLETTETHRGLTRVLVEQMPHLGGSETIRSLEQRAIDLGTGLLAATLQHNGDQATVIWMTVQTIQHLVIRYVLDSPPISPDAFIDGLTRMVSGFVGVAG